MEAHPQRPVPAALEGGHLGGAQAPEVVQRQRLPLVVRQLAEQAVQRPRPLRGERPLPRRWVRVGQDVRERRHVGGRATAAKVPRSS